MAEQDAEMVPVMLDGGVVEYVAPDTVVTWADGVTDPHVIGEWVRRERTPKGKDFTIVLPDGRAGIIEGWADEALRLRVEARRLEDMRASALARLWSAYPHAGAAREELRMLFGILGEQSPPRPDDAAARHGVDPVDAVGGRHLPDLGSVSTAALRAEVARRVSDDAFIRLPGGGTEETHIGRFFGIFPTEGFGDPLALFRERGTADNYLDQRQNADPEGDDHLGPDYTVLRADAVFSVWNSFDQDPFDPPNPNGSVPFTLRTRAEVAQALAAPKAGSR